MTRRRPGPLVRHRRRGRALGGDTTIDAAALDGSGDALLAGARLASYSRSGLTPADPLLMRITPDGVIDRSFGPVGRSIDAVSEFTALAVDGSRILAATSGGEVASLTADDGAAVPSFGVGGLSPAPGARFGDGGPLALGGDLALLGGANPYDGHGALALAGVRLTGRGVLAPLRGRRVTVTRVAGRVAVTVPLSRIAQPLAAAISAPLPVARVDHGEDGIYTPPATILDARSGTVRITGAGGAAVVRGGRFPLRRMRGAVVALRFSGGGCRPATLRTTGRFAVRAGASRVVRTVGHERLRVRPCDRRSSVIRPGG